MGSREGGIPPLCTQSPGESHDREGETKAPLIGSRQEPEGTKGCKGSTWSVEIHIRELEILIKHQRSPGPHISHPELLPIQPAAPSPLQRQVIHSLSHQQSLRTWQWNPRKAQDRMTELQDMAAASLGAGRIAALTISTTAGLQVLPCAHRKCQQDSGRSQLHLWNASPGCLQGTGLLPQTQSEPVPAPGELC